MSNLRVIDPPRSVPSRAGIGGVTPVNSVDTSIIEVHWDKTGNWPAQPTLLKEEMQATLIFCKTHYEHKETFVPFLLGIETLNLELKNAWDKYVAEKVAGSAMAVKYARFGEDMYLHEKITSKEIATNKNIMHYGLLARNTFIDLFKPIGFRVVSTKDIMSPNKLTALTLQTHGQKATCYNYWGATKAGERFGFIYKKRPGMGYALMPYIGKCHPYKEDMEYEDEAGITRWGLWIECGIVEENIASKSGKANSDLKREVLLGIRPKTTREDIHVASRTFGKFEAIFAVKYGL